MNIQDVFKTSSVAAVLLALGACATNPSNNGALSNEPASVSTTASTNEPAAPPTTVIVAGEALVAPAAPAPAKKEGALATIDKLEENPLTLYWRESNSYTYSVGSKLKAEYKPGEGLVLKEGREDGAALECKYSANGKLDTTGLDASGAETVEKACTELMFSFDQQLSD